ncbi:capsule biosynthesis protein [Rubellimicrobium roseum]|uniref:Capsule biosynthesis protein n=1 Tax=Rubellimicrobium roseum TaxID=687525 RepID=A0A5C4NJP3_9RHOB|nr:capsule biosynthesis protein [Rubellimicrobium roseum]
MGAAVVRGRHWGVALSFALLVALPTGVTGWYLWDRAAPRFASEVGFSVRTEDMSSASDLLGGLAALGATSSSKDTDILYRFIQSREIVAAVDARLDLRALWAKGDPGRDPIFAYHPPGTIEDLHDHWNRMVSVYLDSATGLLDVQVQAFDPRDAQAIADAIYEESQALINRLSDIAVDDTTRFARDELDEALERLKIAREAVTRFRNETQIVDPATALQGQMGLLNELEGQLAQALIELDLLRDSASEDDPRVEQIQARVGVIEARMAEERQKLGLGRDSDAAPGLGPSGEAFADLVGEYERLAVDQEFAERTYLAALAAYDSALAEGRRQSRYLAAHVQPTLAERAEYPQRWSTTLLTLLFAALSWMVLTLGAYALKDRR